MSYAIGVADVDVDHAGLDVDRGDPSHPECDVALAAEDAADRVGDVVAAESRRRNLIQQRLKGVEVVRIDGGDIDIGFTEALRDSQPAETGADHHHPMTVSWVPG